MTFLNWTTSTNLLFKSSAIDHWFTFSRDRFVHSSEFELTNADFLRSVDSEKDTYIVVHAGGWKLLWNFMVRRTGRIMPERRTYLVKNFQKEVLKLFEAILWIDLHMYHPECLFSWWKRCVRVSRKEKKKSKKRKNEKYFELGCPTCGLAGGVGRGHKA